MGKREMSCHLKHLEQPAEPVVLRRVVPDVGIVAAFGSFCRIHVSLCGLWITFCCLMCAAVLNSACMQGWINLLRGGSSGAKKRVVVPEKPISAVLRILLKYSIRNYILVQG